MSRAETAADGPNDLGLLVGLVLLADIALLAPGVPQPIEWVVGVPFLLLVPGYAFVAALLPASPRSTVGDAGTRSSRGPDWVARIGIALLLSIVLVAIVGVVASLTVGLTIVPAVLGISVLSGVLAAIAWIRRRSLPATRRSNPFLGTTGSPLGPVAGSPIQMGVFAVAVLALVSAVAFAGTVPPAEQAEYTEFYVLNETENGTLVANDYPTDVVAGEGATLHLGVENAESREMAYEVVVRAQNVTADGTVTETNRLDRFEVQVEQGERAILNRTIVPESPGDGQRIQLLLYKGSAPADPDAASADSALRLWMDVLEPETA